MYTATLGQRIRICKALLGRIGYAHLWTSDGPTSDAKKILDQYGGLMSNPQWIVYQVVWYVWGRPADVKLQEVIQLPEPLGERIVDLFEALFKGTVHVESWLAGCDRVADVAGRRRPRIHRLS